MISGFFNDTVEVNNESRQIKQSGRIVKFLSKAPEGITIPEISKYVKISVPTTTKLINELIDKDYVIDQGKRVTENGRKPVLYSLNTGRFCAVGVEILLKRIQVKILRINKEVVYTSKNGSFTLENTEECLNYVIGFIKEAIALSNIDQGQLMGVGVGITGRVNRQTGETLSYFNFTDKPFAKILQRELNIPVIVDNDTRVLGIAEQVNGKAKKVNNAFIVNMSRGLGVGLIFNKNVISGGNGFAGELGHVQMGESKRLCHCGKQGCLETAASGHAMEMDLIEALEAGQQSIYFEKTNANAYRYDDMLDAALNGDALSIRLIQKQGEILGEALGNMLNLLNPELIVLGGKIAKVGELFADSVKMGIKKSSLINPLMFCKITVSDLGTEAVPDGAAYMLWKKFEMI